jgi:two-component system nitrogen regulation response regulator NtrX
LLVHHFLQMICDDQGVAKKAIDASAIKELQDYNWTGNIRELRNVIERLVILSGKSITKKDVEQFVKL